MNIGRARWRALSSLMFLLTLAAPAAHAATAQQAYENGVKAYRADDFEQALKEFQQAERRGMRNPNLQLNLGLTQYRLGRYEEARGYFESIRGDLRYTAIADYHLGLVAAQLDERPQAARHFEAVQYMASDRRLRNMAVTALMRMDNLGLDQDPFATAAAAPRPDMYLRLASGFDSNPELLPDRIERDVAGDGAGYAELRGDMNLPLLVTAAGETFLRADAQFREHAGETGFDQYSGQVELRQSWRTQQWKFGVNAEGGSAWLDGQAYENLAGGGIDARRETSLVILTLRADSVRVGGEGDFAYLDGWRHRAGIELARPLQRLRLRGNYEYEHNERADRIDGDEFSSHSPGRHAVGAALAVPFGARASLESRVRYRASLYSDANRFLEDGVLVERTRRDDLITVGVRGRLRAGASWNWLADAQYNRNRSSIDDYAYTRHLLLVGIEWLR